MIRTIVIAESLAKFNTSLRWNIFVGWSCRRIRFLFIIVAVHTANALLTRENFHKSECRSDPFESSAEEEDFDTGLYICMLTAHIIRDFNSFVL